MLSFTIDYQKLCSYLQDTAMIKASEGFTQMRSLIFGKEVATDSRLSIAKVRY